MNRLTDSDRNWGPFTLAPWSKTFYACLKTSGDEDEDDTYNVIRLIGFGWAIQIRIPCWIQPCREKKIALSWDEETVKRMGRNWYYLVFPREYGISLSDMGNGYDFFQIHYGPQTHDSETTKDWCCHLPWKQWRSVRWSVYNPNGSHFASEEKGKFFEFCRLKDGCPSSKFKFMDYDGELIKASCIIEEREWHRGEGCFKWLKYLYRPKIRRSLDLKFSSEVGPQKGSWKGGTIGHGIDMFPGETPEIAFRRYCDIEQSRKGTKFSFKFVEPVAV